MTSSLGSPSCESSAPPRSSADSCGPVSSAVAPLLASLRRCFSFIARTKIGSSFSTYWRRSARTAVVQSFSESRVMTIADAAFSCSLMNAWITSSRRASP